MMTDESLLLTTYSPCSETYAEKSQHGLISLLPTPSNNSAGATRP
jgi:hypothetical protein